MAIALRPQICDVTSPYVYRHCGPLPLSEIVVLATPAEILVGEAINKLKVISAERLNTAEHIAI